MTFAGWIVMLVSVGTVTLLVSWCIWKVLTTPGEIERIHGFDKDRIRRDQKDK